MAKPLEESVGDLLSAMGYAGQQSQRPASFSIGSVLSGTCLLYTSNRSKKGYVGVFVRDAKAQGVHQLTSPALIPSELGADNQAYLEREMCIRDMPWTGDRPCGCWATPRRSRWPRPISPAGYWSPAQILSSTVPGAAICAVSYTHLDVYKRQAVQSGGRS